MGINTKVNKYRSNFKEGYTIIFIDSDIYSFILLFLAVLVPCNITHELNWHLGILFLR